MIHGQCIFNSLDGTDFRCTEKEGFPQNKRWYSHKFKGPGLRYEIALCIKTGDIVWAYGGVRCGEYNDLELARLCYTHMVDPHEKTIADSGYMDATFFVNAPPRNLYNPDIYHHYVMKKIMARHESVNGRLKHYAVLREVFRRPIEEHPKIFKACLNLVQLAIENGEPLAKLNIGGY
jgi:hypothetical protein